MTPNEIPISTFDTRDDPTKTTQVHEVLRLTSLRELASQTLKTAWSPIIFNGTRAIANFKIALLLVLDIDGGISVEEALEIFSSYRHVITTTRNHQREKRRGNSVSPPTDRLRVIIPFEKAILSRADYTETMRGALEKFPFADRACVDLARMYFPGGETLSAKEEGHCWPVSRTEINKGHLSKSTRDFLQNGCQPGEWHNRLVKACIDLKEQNYEEREATELLQKITGHLDQSDEYQIGYIFENHQPKYPPRLSVPADEPKCANHDSLILPSYTELLESYQESIISTQQNRQRNIPFICDGMERMYKLSCGLVLIGAMSTHGKSFLASSIASHYFSKSIDKKILFLSNEERIDQIADHISVNALGLKWFNFTNQQYPPEIYVSVAEVSKKVLERIIIVNDPQKQNLNTACLESVKKIIQMAMADESVAMIILDYHQAITFSENNSGMEQWRISKELGSFYKQISAGATKPLIVFAQLKQPFNQSSFAERIQGDSHLFQHAVAALEVIPDKDKQWSELIVHKDRYFGGKGKTILLNWKDGGYEL